MTVEKRIENQSGIRETCIAAGDFERKGHKETAWKNIEVAVELDCPELYERYLSMKFRDFMDWYWNVNGAKELGNECRFQSGSMWEMPSAICCFLKNGSCLRSLKRQSRKVWL